MNAASEPPARGPAPGCGPAPRGRVRVAGVVINEGGVMLFVLVKFALVLAGAAAVFLTLRWVRSNRPGAVALHLFTLAAIRGSTVALALVSLHNAFLLKSL